MTQPEILLRILKPHVAQGITAAEIDQEARLKYGTKICQYNRVISDIRKIYGFTSVESRRCPDGQFRFYWREPEPEQMGLKLKVA